MLRALSQGLYCCDKILKSTYGGKGLIHLTTCSLSSREARAGTQGRDLEAGTEKEAMEEHCLLTCSL